MFSRKPRFSAVGKLEKRCVSTVLRFCLIVESPRGVNLNDIAVYARSRFQEAGIVIAVIFVVGNIFLLKNAKCVSPCYHFPAACSHRMRVSAPRDIMVRHRRICKKHKIRDSEPVQRVSHLTNGPT